ncbi:DUF4097 domain-containing protein [Bacillaceae bacterium SIJ1]|uniref:DUF4097 family beta strand repeat-containing protein n=1 Tax=Litoribacterium kuwaitense TaxID=1398745 RepID=UPI0013EB916E|nr:DUF4097 family beta strand repeat-containing protein [Litoribacterium kuwaitense]NGP46223.1 DUF4097 domain-containing protein [Litoribacterium kuwaitense]
MGKVRLASIIGVILIVFGGVGSVMAFQSIKSVDLQESQDVEADQIENVDIRMPNAYVDILPATSDDIQVELSGKVNDHEQRDFKIQERNGTLYVEYDDEQWKKLFQFIGPKETLQLTVYLPAKTFDSLEVNVSNGTLDAENLQVNELNVKSANGKLNIKDTVAKTVDVKTANGKIVLDHVEGALTGKAANGTISLVTSSLDRPIKFDLNNGSVDIKTENKPTNATIDVEVANGKIDVFGSSDRNHVFGDGENHIDISSMNGGIKITD